MNVDPISLVSDRAVCGSAPGTHGRMVNASTVIVARKTEENS